MTKAIENNQRIEKWDIARGVLMFLVVLGHMVIDLTSDSVRMRALYLFLYSFHMPCFLFLDGLFSKRNIREKRYAHIFSYLLLYLVCKALITITNGIISGNFDFDLLNENGIAWYGLALFWCSLLTIFLNRFSKKWVFCAAIILGCLIGYDNNLGDFLVLSKTIVFFPFFFAGYCIDPNDLEEKLSSIRIKICGTVILLIFAAICFLATDTLYFARVIFSGRIPYSVMGNQTYDMENLVMYGGICRLIYYFLAAALCISFLAIIPEHVHRLSYLAVIGRRTLQIYLLHRPIIFILYRGLHLPEFLSAHSISFLVIIPLAILLTLFLSLPFWESPVRAIIYPQEINKN